MHTAKQFTVKDFIAYNNPCIGCNKSIIFNFNGSGAALRPTVSLQSTIVDLKVSYTHSLQLCIVHKTNKFLCTDNAAFREYLNKVRLNMRTYCNVCNCHVASTLLSFDMNSNYVKPVSIASESFTVRDDNYQYSIDSYFGDEKNPGETAIKISNLDRYGKEDYTRDPFYMDIPILPKYKFKTKQNLINKLKTYMIFS